ncbi:hypothetical protein CDD81_5249 [Ophiocordyceps australis]|uniref:Exonuclease domain-containing protein n=1 Tax=Ophiocordyceps australis TaxID=1399860 RepID=A0A2C5YDV7_9HYPO|nr:hypothetical protein CDD81_5249 [Ophiocordyceps australis]
MSISLKHIPCPAGSNCTAFHCIFGHADDKEPKPSADKKRRLDGHDDSDNDTSSTQGDHGPRKRVKTRDSAASPLASSVHGQIETAPLPAAARTKPLKTATTPVSPPSLSRSRAPTNKQGTNLVPPSSSSAATKTASPSSSHFNKSPTRKKQESLNPRLLNSSPASHETRLKLIRMLHQQFSRLNSELAKDGDQQELQLVLSNQDLIIKALDEEQKTALEKAAVYTNVMKNKVMQYKRMNAAQWKMERQEQVQALKSKHGDYDPAGEPKKIETTLSHSQQVQLLQHLLTPIQGLSKHGYVASVPTVSDISSARDVMEISKGWEKCDRCRQRFQVFPGRREEDGALTTGGACNFHWGKTYYPERAPNDKSRVPRRYQCCGQEVGESTGCFTHNHHVFKHTDAKRMAAVLNFAETPENSLIPPGRAVAFDCEMGYTVHGMELIRLTATEWPSGEELLDVLVQPLGEILDLNSRFSGVWPEDLAKAQPWTSSDSDAMAMSRSKAQCQDGQPPPSEAQEGGKKQLKIVSSPQAARELLFSLIAPSTPLIGHGLENDLNAVRIVHPNLIDTVLLFPHKKGLPFRCGLKALMAQYLNRTIQQETGPQIQGHDSAEDARAAGDLVRLKVVQLWKDLKLAGWNILDDKVVCPEAESEAGNEGEASKGFVGTSSDLEGLILL